MIRRNLPTVALAICVTPPVAADDTIAGMEFRYQSPDGVAELCVQIGPMPDAVYSEADLAIEALYCGIDLYAPTIALCPKTWSTSPAMVIHDLSSGPFVGDREGFEDTACVLGKDAKDQSGARSPVSSPA